MAEHAPIKKPADVPGGWQPILRRADQAAVATLVLAALVAMGAYWIVQGGHRGELIEIDRVAPLSAQYHIDINRAEWAEFAELPDIGQTLARRIVESRTKGGPFVDHDDLRRVEGIGPITLERIRPYLLPMPDEGDVAGSMDRSPDT